MDVLQSADPDIWQAIQNERRRQQQGLEMIASENFTSRAVMEAQGSVLTNKYAEGLPGKRYYGGCEFVDEAEQLAIDRAKQLFGAEPLRYAGFTAWRRRGSAELTTAKAVPERSSGGGCGFSWVLCIGAKESRLHLRRAQPSREQPEPQRARRLRQVRQPEQMTPCSRRRTAR